MAGGESHPGPLDETLTPALSLCAGRGSASGSDREGSIEHMFVFARGGNQASRSSWYMVRARSAVAKGEVYVGACVLRPSMYLLKCFSFLGCQQDTGGRQRDTRGVSA